MKFSQLAVSAFLASAALAVPVADPNVVTVVETAQEVAYVTAVQNVYVTVAAGQEPSATSVPSADAVANVEDDVVYVDATVYVDQFGNSITLDGESAAPVPTSEVSLVTSKSTKGHGHRHKHSSTASSAQTIPTSSVFSDPAVATLTISSVGPASSSEPTSSSAPVTSQVEVESFSAPVTSQIEAESSAPAPTSSPVTSDVVVVTVSPEPTTTSESSTPAPATSTVNEVSTPSASADVAQAVETEEDSVASVSTSSSSDNDFASSCTNLHNSLRAKHSAGALTWNSTLSDYALEYLSKQNCVFEHSGGPYGENIAMGFENPTLAIQAWYDEEKDYDYSAGQFSMITGHFTQVVWKETTQLGCNKVDCGNSGSFFACEYYPSGNVIGFFLENVSAS
ncbi:hypothetical protein D0Z00_001337 [Geotrichum galactomycetum]|uniref:Uncharacterized protein n=1 Tax=Geotrichum galactomycetum TaxID=27317 RepID=A0ACB6V761_9ASCO|nr:hypothetical protein D0Z00_001337 [Geotrichum candidum]